MYQQFRNSLKITFLLCVLFLCASPVYAAININTADIETLMTLNGIGEVKAQAIIDYRTGPHGPFETLEELLEVSGIGTATFNNIKAFITLGDTTPPPQDPQVASTTLQIQTAPVSSGGGGVWIQDTKSISVTAGEDRTVFVGADSIFEARVTGAAGDPITNARVVWSFGNGDRSEGRKILYNFPFPGEYVVIVDAANDVYSASDRVRVNAIPALVAVTEVTPEYIALKNSTAVEVDIGGWMLFSLGVQFQFPENTVIAAGQEVRVSNKRTGLSGSDPGSVALQYPNGLVAAVYEYPLFLSASKGSPPAGGGVSYTAPIKTPSPGAPSALGAAAEGNLITSPISALEGDLGVWPWIVGVGTMAGLVGMAVVYARRRKGEYEFEEIS